MSQRNKTLSRAVLPAGLLVLATSTALASPQVNSWTLDNGLQVAHSKIDHAPLVSVQVWYRVGSKDEPRGRQGMARLFERVLSDGSTHVPPGRHQTWIQRLGGTSKSQVTEDSTAFYNTVPRQYFDFAVQLEADRMRQAVFRKPAIAKRRSETKELIATDLRDPVQSGVARFLELAYTKHPYAWTATGNSSDIEKIKDGELKKYYNSYFVPNNALLVIVGDVDQSAAKASAQKWFGSLEKMPSVPRPAQSAKEPTQSKVRRKTTSPERIGLVMVGHHIPSAKHKDIYALQMLSLVLGAGEASPLNRQLVLREGIAVKTAAQVLLREDPGLFALLAVFRGVGPDGKPDSDQGKKVEKALVSLADYIKSKGPTVAQLAKARAHVVATYAAGTDSVERFGNQLGTSWSMTGNPVQFVNDLKELTAVTADDIKRVTTQYVTENNRSILIVPAITGEQQ